MISRTCGRMVSGAACTAVSRTMPSNAPMASSFTLLSSGPNMLSSVLKRLPAVDAAAPTAPAVDAAAPAKRWAVGRSDSAMRLVLRAAAGA